MHPSSDADLPVNDTRRASSRTAASSQTLAAQRSDKSANGRSFSLVSYFRKRLSQLVG
ncbi:hypothetical protein PSAB6_340288 [Paraburkholderia sabiae]|nr:hypothetical protein PSAB6_340288 [Paraburkholderia sabiae]